MSPALASTFWTTKKFLETNILMIMLSLIPNSGAYDDLQGKMRSFCGYYWLRLSECPHTFKDCFLNPFCVSGVSYQHCWKQLFTTFDVLGAGKAEKSWTCLPASPGGGGDRAVPRVPLQSGEQQACWCKGQLGSSGLQWWGCHDKASREGVCVCAHVCECVTVHVCECVCMWVCVCMCIWMHVCLCYCWGLGKMNASPSPCSSSSIIGDSRRSLTFC